MSAATDIAKFAAADIRNGITVITAFVLGLLLLFFNDLTLFCRQTIVPALVIYTIGTALLGHIQILVTCSTNAKARADENAPRGINENHLRWIIALHVLWFLAFACFVTCKGHAQQDEYTVPSKATPSATSDVR